jgi:hypothetical protein
VPAEQKHSVKSFSFVFAFREKNGMQSLKAKKRTLECSNASPNKNEQKRGNEKKMLKMKSNAFSFSA